MLSTPSGKPASWNSFQASIGADGISLGRLQDEGIPAGDRDRVHPHRHHGREVERGDAGDHAQWLTVGDGIDAGADIAGEIALEQIRDTAGEFDDLDAAGDFAQRIVVGLAVFAGNLAGDVARVRGRAVP
jgi:hypothetical protein